MRHGVGGGRKGIREGLWLDRGNSFVRVLGRKGIGDG